MKIRIRLSYDSFRELRESGSYYVDKTGIIKEYLSDGFEKAVLFTRPRRFGKTLTLTMFRDFLDVRQDSREIFSGLRIMDSPEVVREYMNQYPVVFISLKEVFGRNFEEVFRSFQIAVSRTCEELKEAFVDQRTDPLNMEAFLRLRRKESRQQDTEQALDLLCQMLRQVYGKPAFVLIDEYDVPMAKSFGTPHYDQVREMIERTLSYVCKTNKNVQGVLISGCLYAVKNSTYTGVNNIIPYTVFSPLYDSAIGFTDEEVGRILGDAGVMDQRKVVCEWYDGYIFGREKMYCPWEVLCYVKSLLDGSYSETMGPKSYWMNTSDSSENLIHGFLGKTSKANERFELLLAGRTIDCRVGQLPTT